MKTLRLLVLLATLAFGSRTHAQIQVADSLALVDLFNATSGAAWVDNSNWLSGPVDSWFGVSTTADRVTAVRMVFNGLDGNVPASISDLSRLDTLELTKNNLNSITDLSGLGDVTVLRLGSCGIDVVPSLSGLANLREVDLSQNDLMVCPDMEGLEELIELDLSFNELVEIPSLYDLLDLEILDLSQNQLSWIPSLAGNSLLTELDLRNNSLTKLPDISANTALTRIEARENLLRDLPDLSGITALATLNVQENLLDIDDLLAADAQASPSSFGYSPQNTVLGTKTDNVAPAFSFISYTVNIDAQAAASALYAWEYEGTSLTSPTLADTALELGILGSALSLPGDYVCTVSDPGLPGLEIPYAAATLSDASACTTIISGVNDVIMSTAPVVFDGVDFCLEADWTFTNPAFAFDITIRNCTIWVCEPGLGIDVLDGVNLTLENVILQPCNSDSTWRGIDIKDNADVLVDECVFVNAEIGVDVSTFSLTEIRNSDFENCQKGVRLFGSSAFGSTAVDQVHGNTFSIDDGVPDYTDPSYVGVEVRSRNLGTFGFSSGVFNNAFINLNSLPCLDYCGIIAENAGIVIEDNNYVDMYCGVDLKNPQSANVVLNDTVLNLNVAECTSVSHLISNATQPAKFSGITMITAPSPYDSIFVGVGAISCTNWVEIDNNELQNFDHSFVINDCFRTRIFDNLAENSYVGAYFRNTRQAQFRCNDIDDILCGTGYRVDNNLLEFVEMMAPNWFAARLDFSSNVLTHPPFNNENNPDPDHDDEYSMRFFGCPESNPSVACALGESVEVVVLAPGVSQNDMDSLRIEFTASLPVDPFGTPSGSCSPGPLRMGSLSAPEYAEAWLDWAYSSPAGTGDFRLDILREIEAEGDELPLLGVYPNPASDYVMLELPVMNPEDVVLEVWDVSGRLRLREMARNSLATLDLSSLEPGIYEVRSSGALLARARLIVQR